MAQIIPQGFHQIRRTLTVNRGPSGTDLRQGQLFVEMASNPPRLYAGVPTSVDVTGARELNTWPYLEGAQLIADPATAGQGFAGLRLIRSAGGGYIKHNGEWILIPENGFAITTDNSVGGGAPLEPDTTYYLFFIADRFGASPRYLFINAIHTTHAPSTMVRNEGVEVSVVAGVQNPARTLIGMVQTNEYIRFYDRGANRHIRTWHGNRRVAIRGPQSGFVTVPPTDTWESLNNQASFLLWENEVVSLSAIGFGFTDPARNMGVGLMMDGSLWGIAQEVYSHGSWLYAGHSPTYVTHELDPLAEGFHVAETGVRIPSGACVARSYIVGTIG